jgi:transcriptional antiterminator NusG
MALRWYVVHTYSGFENRVKLSLQDRVESAGMQAYFSDILIPEEDIVELVAETLITRIDEGTLKPKPKFKFDVGDHVRIIDGPFTNFDGIIDEVKPDKGKLRVIVSIFGRSTPVELDFIQVAQN